MARELCPFNTLDDVDGVWVSDEVGWQFTCEGPDHPEPGPYVWFRAPEPPAGTELSGVAEEFGLAVEIPAVLSQFVGKWVEYGVFEQAYAVSHPKEWAELIARYSHTAVAAKRYTVSAFLASTLGQLSRQGVVAFHAGPATGRWAYNSGISWWSLHPAPDWNSRMSWADTGFTIEYVEGQTEV